MSLKTLDKPQVIERPRAYVDSRTSVRPEIGVRVQVTPKKKSKSKSGLGVTALLTACCFVGSVIVTSLWGNVELEKARYREREAISRANEAKRVESGLRARVEALTSGASVNDWASQNGFDVYHEPSTLVATAAH